MQLLFETTLEVLLVLVAAGIFFYLVINNLIERVPEGSVLGPLLFLIFINDLPTCLTQTSINIYADDSVILNAVDSIG